MVIKRREKVLATRLSEREARIIVAAAEREAVTVSNLIRARLFPASLPTLSSPALSSPLDGKEKRKPFEEPT